MKLMSPLGLTFSLIMLFLVLFVISVFAPVPSREISQAIPRVESTISADGEMIAALDWIPPHRVPRLRIKRLLPEEEPWQEVPISPYINTIRFGLIGKQLLLTEVIDESLRSVLVEWNMDELDEPPSLLYEGYRLSFPIEFKPGHYLIRSCSNERPGWPCTERSFNWQWEWINNNQQLQVFNRTDVPEPLLYSQPSVVDERGFFWFTRYKKNRFITLSFNNQQLETPDLPFDDTTTNIECDGAIQRCLRLFIRDSPIRATYTYGISVQYDGQSCDQSTLAGYGDKFSLTPDGNAAVIAWADSANQPRHIVVMRFTPGQCEPISFERYPFEENPS